MDKTSCHFTNLEPNPSLTTSSWKERNQILFLSIGVLLILLFASSKFQLSLLAGRDRRQFKAQEIRKWDVLLPFKSKGKCIFLFSHTSLRCVIPICDNMHTFFCATLEFEFVQVTNARAVVCGLLWRVLVFCLKIPCSTYLNLKGMAIVEPVINKSPPLVFKARLQLKYHYQWNPVTNASHRHLLTKTGFKCIVYRNLLITQLQTLPINCIASQKKIRSCEPLNATVNQQENYG